MAMLAPKRAKYISLLVESDSTAFPDVFLADFGNQFKLKERN